MLNATLVAIAEHGFVPRVQAARMTLAAAPDAMQGAVAAGMLGCGSVILGATETAGRMFMEIERGRGKAATRRAAARRRCRAARPAIPGYGHPEHKKRDPRVDALFAVAAAAGGGQRYVEIAKACEAVIPALVGKDLRLNVSAAIPAVLLGVGFPVEGAERRAAPGAHRQPGGAPQRGDWTIRSASRSATRRRARFEYTGVPAGSDARGARA